MFLPSNITLKFGDSGDFVAELQRRLANVSAYPEDQVNGFFDGTTANGVSAFQTRHGLRADGVAGPETLRRLFAAMNGGGSGDNKTGSGNQEEEAQIAADRDHMLRNFHLMNNETLGMGPGGPASAQETNAWGTAAEQPNALYGAESAPHSQQALRDAQQGQSYDQIAQSLQQQTQLSHQMMMQQQMQQQDQLQMLQQQQMQQQMMMQPQQDPRLNDPALQQQLQQQAQMQAQRDAQLPMPQQGMEQQLQASEQGMQTEKAPRGIVGRAMDRVDALLQKLSSYFEARLSPDVLDEVKNIGHTMMQSGVRETPIPGSAEQVRTQQLPARGPEAPQLPQRQ